MNPQRGVSQLWTATPLRLRLDLGCHVIAPYAAINASVAHDALCSRPPVTGDRVEVAGAGGRQRIGGGILAMDPEAAVRGPAGDFVDALQLVLQDLTQARRAVELQPVTVLEDGIDRRANRVRALLETATPVYSPAGGNFIRASAGLVTLGILGIEPALFAPLQLHDSRGQRASSASRSARYCRSASATTSASAA
jgi:hypothetical protein